MRGLKHWPFLAATIVIGFLTMGVAAITSQAHGRPSTSLPHVTIRVGVGIGAVSLDESGTAVRAALGRPARVVAPIYLYRRGQGVAVAFDYWHRVDAISTTSTRARTRSGIGPGASWTQFQHAYRHARCFHSSVQPWTHICTLSTSVGSARVQTNFLFRTRLSLVQIFVVGSLPAVGMH